MERSRSVVVLGFDIGAVGEERRDDLVIFVVHGQVERRFVLRPEAVVDVGAGIDEGGEHRRVRVAASGFRQRRFAV